jgi:hypothetical protein
MVAISGWLIKPALSVASSEEFPYVHQKIRDRTLNIDFKQIWLSICKLTIENN